MANEVLPTIVYTIGEGGISIAFEGVPKDLPPGTYDAKIRVEDMRKGVRDGRHTE